jgi:hypothetical protein
MNCADTHSILNRWKNHFCQLLNAHRINDVRRTEVHTAEPLVSSPSAFEIETAIRNLKKYKSLCIDQIAAESNTARSRHMPKKLLGIISLDFQVTDQLLIMYCLLGKYFRNKLIKRCSPSAIYTLKKPLIQL